MRIPMRNGEPLSLEEMQQRQAEMEDRLNAATIQMQLASVVIYEAMMARGFCDGCHSGCTVCIAFKAYEEVAT